MSHEWRVFVVGEAVMALCIAMVLIGRFIGGPRA
jgi:hypothetical protein